MPTAAPMTAAGRSPHKANVRMPTFVFQLDGVLRQRKLVEEQKQRDLAAVQAELTPLEAQLRLMDREMQSATGDVRANRLTGRLDLAFLAAHRRYTLAMQRKAVTLAQQMAAVQARVEAARKALVDAARQRKVIEKLREKRHAEWAAGVARREAIDADEVAMQISSRNAAAAVEAGEWGAADFPADVTEVWQRGEAT